MLNRFEEHFWPMDVAEILKIRTSPRRRQDFIGWYPELHGIFTVKSTYKLAVEAHELAHAGGASSTWPEGDRPIWSLIWKSHVPLKMRIMAWKTSTGALATNLGKVRRHIPTRSTCPMCGTESESSFHALITCPHAREVWDSLRESWIRGSSDNRTISFGRTIGL